jgi:Raf kinase inhibitor-like YbhB/YbcL family protein
MAFSLRSPVVTDGGAIPVRYTGDGENLSPPLRWSDPPPGTRSFVLVVEDPDAPEHTYRHWGVYNIGSDTSRLLEGDAGRFDQAVNDSGNRSYDGPKPPRGRGPHHYHFRLAALNTPQLDLPPAATVADLWQAARPHIIGEANLVGVYER